MKYYVARPDFVLETDRLRLRPLQQADGDAMYEILSDPEVMRHYPRTLDRGLSMEWLERNIRRYGQYGIGLWALEKKGDRNLLGVCGLIPQEVDGETQIEIGYILHRSAWGNGYATEAAAACRDFAARELDVDRVISLIDPDNHASIRVAERIGMRWEKETVMWGKLVCVYSILLAGSKKEI